MHSMLFRSRLAFHRHPLRSFVLYYLAPSGFAAGMKLLSGKKLVSSNSTSCHSLCSWKWHALKPPPLLTLCASALIWFCVHTFWNGKLLFLASSIDKIVIEWHWGWAIIPDIAMDTLSRAIEIALNIKSIKKKTSGSKPQIRHSACCRQRL